MGLFSGIKSFVDTIFVQPAKGIGEGLGIGIAAQSAMKEQEILDQKNQELQTEMVRRIKEARNQGDTEREKRLIGALQKYNPEPVSIIEKTIAKAPTNRQVIASAAELALFAVPTTRLAKAGKISSFAKGAGLPTKGRFGQIPRTTMKTYDRMRRKLKLETLKDAGKIQKFGKTTGKEMVREAMIGSGFFAAMEAQRKDASTEDIVRAAEMGALFGAGTMGVVSGLGFAGRKAAPHIKSGARKATQGLERKVAAGQKRRVGAVESDSVVDEVLSTIGKRKRTPSEFLAEKALRGVEGGRMFKERWVDKTAPFKRVEDDILAVKDGPLNPEEAVWRDARTLNSASDGIAQSKTSRLSEALEPYRDISDKAEAYLTLLDNIDRAKRKQLTPLGKNVKELNQKLKRFAEEVGPEDMERIGKVRDIVRKWDIDYLDERVRAGLIDSKTRDKLLKAHPHYVPHKVITEIDKKTLKGLGESMSVSKTDILEAYGSVQNIESPIEQLVRRAPYTQRVIEKNKLLNNLVKAHEKHGVIPGMRLKTSKDLPQKGLEDTITMFREGKKEQWIVPKDLAAAIKDTDAALMPRWFEWLTTPQRILKHGATGKNPSFAIPNKFKDEQTAVLTMDGFIKDAQQRYGINTDFKLPKNKKQRKLLYAENGGYGASIFKEGEDAIWQRSKGHGIAEKLDSNLNPLEAIDKMNKEIEQHTRLRVFQKAMENGLDPKSAALVSRDASIDFAKMGSWMRPLNQAVPFLNARVQGFLNLPKAAASNPEAFARMQLWTAVYPTMALHQHNRRFESYNNISQYYKNRYWVIMTGEQEALDKQTGEKIVVPQFLTIPKGEGQALVAGPLQYFLDRSDEADFRTTSEMIADTIGSASPLEFQSFDSSNMFLSGLSQLGPMATIPVGLGTNTDPFFGTPIVPESREGASKELQVKPSTPESTRWLANIMNVAPAKLEFVLNSFGGLPKDMQDTADIMMGIVGNDDLREDLRDKSLSDTGFGEATKVPISRRFFREANPYYSPENKFRRDQKERLNIEVTDDTIRRNELASEIVRKIRKQETIEDRMNVLNSYGDSLTPEVRKRISYLQKRNSTVEALSSSDSVELRARYIDMRLQEMKAMGAPQEDVVEFLNELQRNSILTDSVRVMISILNNVDHELR